MSTFRVTHIDAERCKRVLHVIARRRVDAVAVAMQAYGEAWAVSAIRAARQA